MKIRKAVVIATETNRSNMAVEMMPLIDKPLIEYVMEEIEGSGIEEVLIILGENSDALIQHFKAGCNKRPMVYFTRVASVTDYAEAVLCSKSFVGNEPFVLVNGAQVFMNQSEPVTKQLLEAYKYLKHSVLAMQQKGQIFELIDAAHEEEDFYSISGISLESKGVESSGAYNFCGRSVLRADIFDYLSTVEERTFGYHDFTSALNRMMKDQRFYGVLIKGEQYDLTTHSGYIKSMIDLALERSDLKHEIERHIGERMLTTC